MSRTPYKSFTKSRSGLSTNQDIELARRSRSASTRYYSASRTRSSLGSLCKPDTTGTIPKSLMTPENFAKLKSLARRHNVKMTDENGLGLSYSQYCLLIKDKEFYKPQCCPSGQLDCGNRERVICCQAILENGQRCNNPAKFVYDLMSVGDKRHRRAWISRIPDSIKSHMSTKQRVYYEQILASYPCCFFCGTHISAYLAEGASYLTNITYYGKHPEEVLAVFFNDVQITKSYGFPTGIAVGTMRSRDEITQSLSRLIGAMSGAVSTYGMFIRVFFFIFDRYLKDLLPAHYISPLLTALNAYYVQYVPL